VLVKLIHRPTEGPEEWKQFLAEPDKHWKPGYSAHCLACCWEGADGLPVAVRDVFRMNERLRDFEPLLAIPEAKVELPGGGWSSQTDLWLLGRVSDGLVSVAVEGKVAETFGPALDEWQTACSAGKAERRAFLLDVLRLQSPDGRLRYQLLHRTASAILLARRFHARHAVMAVHSFSDSAIGFDDYQAFASALGAAGVAGRVTAVPGHTSPTLSLGWVQDKKPYA
jgi:hypothetical protein